MRSSLPRRWRVSGPCGRYREAAKYRLLLGLIGLSICFAGCAKKTVVEPEPTEVYVAKPLQRDVSIYSDWMGTAVGFVDAQIHSQVSGYLLSQNYKEGPVVKKAIYCFKLTRDHSRLSWIKRELRLKRPRPS
jgi:hypothetical protein